ncbi:GNAT family N-acetyltransferase [Halobacillus salinarum]|uniref:GNAT family N-acetyltransferase n=1 Tax=Halobacillus salinarum TaxID=2932257 RepID=A0ABY4EKZ8_9BACI|nr:GNAT family protein [Halobacillus salinarum]UOQ45141.1 GNAT family N-acetyltransferase [Halobacillus salinarum]
MTRIKGSKLTLRKATQQDAYDMYYWKFEDPVKEAKEWNGPYIPETFHEKEEFLKAWDPDEEIMPGTLDMLIIEVNSHFIGAVMAYWIDKNTDWLETGIVIYDPQYWNGGYGYEAYYLWLDYLFQTTGLHRLGMSTWSGNHRMMRVAEKTGMIEEARIRQARQVEGKYYDAVKMGVLRSEFYQ